MAKKKSVSKTSFKAQIFLICSVITAAIFLPSTALLFIGMMPTIAAGFVDRSKRKTKAVTVGAMNMAGCAPFLLELWYEGHSFEKSVAIFTDPMAIVVMYSAAGVGYLIDWSVAGIVASILFQKGLARQKAIRARQQELVERWGREVSGELPLDQQGFPVENPVKSKG
jgi:hypothetical protein